MRDGKAITEARLLWLIERPDFAIVGYDLSKDHWRDPIAFLREHNADTHPAPYRLRRLKARKPRGDRAAKLAD